MNFSFGALNWLADVSAKDLFSAAIGSLAGAWGGAYAIQRIGDNAKRREQLGKEVLACNATIELCGAFGNTYAGLKRQHVGEFVHRYVQQYHLAHEAHERERRTGVPEAPALGELDMGKLDPVRLRIERLERLLTEELKVGGRPVGLLNYLNIAMDNLNSSITQRNELIDRLRQLPRDEMVASVFGLKHLSDTDRTYPDLVRGIGQSTDDCIVFTRQICMDLEAYGERIRAIYLRKFRGRMPRTSRIDFGAMEKFGIAPDFASYRDLIEGYVMPPQSTLGRRGAKWRVGVRRSLRWLRGRWRALTA